MLRFVLALIVAPVLAFANPCEEDLSTKGYLTFAQIGHDLPPNPNWVRQFRITDQMATQFLDEGWPVLVATAEEQNQTVSEMFAEYFGITEMLVADLEAMDSVKFRDKSVLMKNYIASIKATEELKPGQKLKANHWKRLRETYRAVVEIATFATLMETVHRRLPSFHPMWILSRKQVEAVMDSLEDSALDRAAKFVEQRKLKKDRRELIAALAQSKTAEQTEAKEPVETAIEQEPIEEEQLVIVLRDQLPLRAGMVYQAVNPRGEELTVQLSQEVIGHAEGGEEQNIRRLLKGIFYGTGWRTGVKALFDIGPRIVELKVPHNAHKRLLGCLEGRHLRLLKFETMGSTRASYFRKIPHDLCKTT